MPRNKYPEETRKKILDAGFRVFQEKGYESSTILDIVDNMDGLTRGAFYHHFKSKEEVLSAICERYFYANNPFEKVLHKKNLSGLEKIQLAMKINLTSQLDLPADFDFLRAASTQLNESPQFFMWQMKFNATMSPKFLLPLIKEGIADGSIKEQDPIILSELFVVLLNFWMSSGLFQGGIEYTEKKAITIDEILTQFGLSIFDAELEEIGQEWIESTVE